MAIKKCKYFGIKELVSKKTYDYYVNQLKWGEDFLWKFFDADVLQDLDAIREGWAEYLKKAHPTEKPSIIINNWIYGGDLTQCGLRANTDPLVMAKKTPYCSGHCLAMAFDLHAGNGRHAEFHNFVCEFIRQGKTKKIKRVENIKSAPTWCHIDAFQTVNGLEIFSV